MLGRYINNRGFGLVEVLIVMGLMGLVIMAVLSTQKDTRRSTYVQEEVVEVQQNLRVALEKMARDIRMAGFLVPAGKVPIVKARSDSITINTVSAGGQVALVGEDFVSSANSTDQKAVIVDSSEMVDLFNRGDLVRIVRPANQNCPIDRVFTVTTIDRRAKKIFLSGFTEECQFKTGDMIVRVSDSNDDGDNNPNTNPPPHPNTISYFLEDDPDSEDPNMFVLKRRATGVDTQVVAQKISRNGLLYGYLIDDGRELSDAAGEEEKIRAVRITLSAAADATKTGAEGYGGGRARQMTNVVALRNR